MSSSSVSVGRQSSGFWLRNRRRDPDILYFGDSMFRYLSENLPSKLQGANPAVLFQSGSKIQEAFSLLEDHLDPHLAAIVLHVGANNVKEPCVSVENCLSHYTTLISKILSVCPQIKIFISSIIPRGANGHVSAAAVNTEPWRTGLSDRINFMISDLNEALSDLCSDDPNLQFISHTHLFYNRYGVFQRYLLAQDGLHFSFKGVEYVGGNLGREIDIWMERRPTPPIAATKPHFFPKCSVKVPSYFHFCNPDSSPLLFNGEDFPPLPNQSITRPSTSSPSITRPSPSSQSITRPSTSSPSITRPSPSIQSITRPSTSSQSITRPSPSSQSITRPSPSSQSITRPSTSSPSITRPSPSSQSITRPSTSSQSITRPSPSSQSITRPSPSSQSITRPSPSSQSTTRPSTSSSKGSRFSQIHVGGIGQLGVVCRPKIYSRIPVRIVKGCDDPLSNFYPCSLKFDGLTFNSAEHAYQYHKAKFYNRTDIMTDVLNARHASGAKKSTKTLRETDAWLASRDNLVLNILKYKYEQVPIFQQTLQHTAHHQYRHTVSSTYWGTGNYGTGQNIFGKLLHTLVTNKLHIQPPCTVQKSPSTVSHPISPTLPVVPPQSTSDPSTNQFFQKPPNQFFQKQPNRLVQKQHNQFFKKQPNQLVQIQPNQLFQIKPNQLVQIQPNQLVQKPPNQLFQKQKQPNQLVQKPPNQLVQIQPNQFFKNQHNKLFQNQPNQFFPKTTKPILPKPTQPIISKPTKPILSKPTKPIFPKPTQPILSKPTKQILPKHKSNKLFLNQPNQYFPNQPNQFFPNPPNQSFQNQPN